MSENNNSNGPPQGPPAAMHFLNAFARGALALTHLAFGANPDEEQEEAPPRRRRRIAGGKRAGSGSCCNGSRRKKSTEKPNGEE